MEPLARCAEGRVQAVESLVRPFSNFHFLSSHPCFRLAGPSLRRIFSEGRRAGALTLAVEVLDESGETQDETNSLEQRFTSFDHSELYRLTFWSVPWHPDHGEDDHLHPSPDSLLGYAIVRADHFTGERHPSVHVFESVFRKYAHFHNFVPCCAQFEVEFGGSRYFLDGVMYCQQNVRTKACAQVALRSLLATRFHNRPVTYSEINSSAGQSEPTKGLSSNQIRAVLDDFEVNFRDLDYTVDATDSLDLGYDKLLYAGLENGGGGLLGFDLAGVDENGKAISPGRHIIPFFGHTFNQDTWAPRAQNAYFHIGEETRYIPSDEWLSSFIGHDDNFGSNFCVPRGFLDPRHVSYVVALLPKDFQADPVKAEVAAAHVLYTVFSLVPSKYRQSFWHRQLSGYVSAQDVVLRTHAVSRDAYAAHLGSMQDWDGNASPFSADDLASLLPATLWMVELSVPEVFSTNYGKIGEIIIAGDADLSMEADASDEDVLNAYMDTVAFVRLPGIVLVRVSVQTDSVASRLVPLKCDITGHSPLYGCPPYA